MVGPGSTGETGACGSLASAGTVCGATWASLAACVGAQAGMTALHLACGNGFTATAELLVSLGADMAATDRVSPCGGACLDAQTFSNA